jgi:hypothetical protein
MQLYRAETVSAFWSPTRIQTSDWCVRSAIYVHGIAAIIVRKKDRCRVNHVHCNREK